MDALLTCSAAGDNGDDVARAADDAREYLKMLHAILIGEKETAQPILCRLLKLLSSFLLFKSHSPSLTSYLIECSASVSWTPSKIHILFFCVSRRVGAGGSISRRR